MGTAGEQPGLGRDLQPGRGLPEGAGDGQARQVLGRPDHLDLVEDEPEPVAEIEEAHRRRRVRAEP